jgi:hypothetical protein
MRGTFNKTPCPAAALHCVLASSTLHRPQPLLPLLLLLLQFGVETMMHLTCTNMPVEALDNALAEVCGCTL